MRNQGIRLALVFTIALLLAGGVADRALVSGRGVLSDVSHGRSDVGFRSELAASGGYEVYRELAQYAAGSRVVLDAQSQTLDKQLLQGLVRPSEIRQEVLPAYRVPEGAVTSSGSGRHGRWALSLSPEPGPVQEVYVWAGPAGIVVADSRLVLDHAVAQEIRTPRLLHGLWFPFRPLVDLTVLLALALAGSALLPRSLGAVWIRAPLALMVGVATLVTMGIFRIRGAWSLAAISVLYVIGSQLQKRVGAEVGFVRSEVHSLGWFALVLALTVFLSRMSGFFWAPTIDSIRYLAGGQALADGQFTLDLIRAKRGVGLQSLHSVGFALGAEGIQSIGPVVMVAAGMLLLQYPRVKRAEEIRPAKALAPVFAGLAFIALIAQPTMLTWAGYVNSHVLVGGILLGVVVLLELMANRTAGAHLPSWLFELALAPLIAALVFLRGEAPLLVALLLIGTQSSRAPAPKVAWRALGVSTIAWNGLVALGAVAQAAPVQVSVLGLMVLGALFIVVPWASAQLSEALVRRLPLVAVSSLWSLLLANQALGLSTDFQRLLSVNLGQGIGRWGLAGPLLFIVGGLAVVGRPSAADGPGIHASRWVVAGYVPLQFLVKLGDQGLRDQQVLSLGTFGNFAWDDSTNRMWTHVVFLVILLLIWRWMRETGSRRSLGISGTHHSETTEGIARDAQ